VYYKGKGAYGEEEGIVVCTVKREYLDLRGSDGADINLGYIDAIAALSIKFDLPVRRRALGHDALNSRAAFSPCLFMTPRQADVVVGLTPSRSGPCRLRKRFKITLPRRQAGVGEAVNVRHFRAVFCVCFEISDAD
jgi:hypothetical protein